MTTPLAPLPMIALRALGCLAAATAAAAEPDVPRHFTFAPGAAAPAIIAVSPEITYSRERGFGFEPGVPRHAAGGGVTSDAPFCFSVALPEGNWTVTVTLGSAEMESVTTVKAELGRLALEQVRTARFPAAAMGHVWKDCGAPGGGRYSNVATGRTRHYPLTVV